MYITVYYKLYQLKIISPEIDVSNKRLYLQWNIFELTILSFVIIIVVIDKSLYLDKSICVYVFCFNFGGIALKVYVLLQSFIYSN